MNNTENAIRIENIPMSYYLLESGKKEFPRTWLTKKFLKRLGSTDKTSVPLFELWSAYPICLIAADFDLLPKHLITKASNRREDWAAFRAYLQWRYGHLGAVLTTPSSKAKILFKVFLPLDQPMTVDIAHDTLRHLLEEDERGIFDRSNRAAMRCFINMAMYQDLVATLDHLPLHCPILDSTPEEAEPGLNQVDEQAPFVWNLLPADAPELDLLDGVLKTRAEWFLARFICGYAKGGLESIDLGQRFLAEQSKFHLDPPLSTAVAYKALQSFMRMGFLVRVSDHFLPSRKSMSYRAHGLFRTVLEKVLERIITSNPVPRRAPTAIADGEWEEVLWRETNHFSSREAYMSWVEKLPNLDARKKNRRKKAERAWAAHVHPRWNTKAPRQDPESQPPLEGVLDGI
jgi:hypothetical protein